MMGAVPNPGGGEWTILFAGFSDEEDPDLEQEEIIIVALTDEDDLPGVSEREYRFELYEDSEENPHAVYFGVALHRHEEDGSGCERFTASEGETDLDDVPEDLIDALSGMLEMGVHPPGEEPVDAEPVSAADLIEPDTDPGGMFH